MHSRRVVVTGLGAVTPLGCGSSFAWEQLIAGACGVQTLKGDEYNDLPSKVAALVPCGKDNPTLFDEDLISRKYVLLKITVSKC